MLELEEKLLNIIDNANEMSRGDLQGIVEAFVKTYCTDLKGYCGFENVDDLINDHRALKEQIKNRELECDKITDVLSYSNVTIERQHETHDEHIKDEITGRINYLSHEMMAINIEPDEQSKKSEPDWFEYYPGCNPDEV